MTFSSLLSHVSSIDPSASWSRSQSNKMVFVHPRLAAIFLVALVAFASVAFAVDPSDEVASDKLTQARAQQGGMFAADGRKWKLRGEFNPLRVPDFHSSAWELANSEGVMPLGVVYRVTRTPRSFGRVTETSGPTENFFYSIVQPGTHLGRRMGLIDPSPRAKHKAASVLWKYKDGRPSIEHVDLIADRDFPWRLYDLQSVLRQH